jgi:hypothetical protein
LDKEQAIPVRELDPTAHLALQHNQLLPQRGVLCFKSAPGLEERGSQVQEEEYQRGHGGRRLAILSLIKTNEVFGTHKRDREWSFHRALAQWSIIAVVVAT